jgi:small subunit ribosomal protein S2e
MSSAGGGEGFGRRGARRGGDRRGDRRGGRRGDRRGKRDGDKQEWVPTTKLGRLVKGGQIKSLDEIFMFSLPIKEPQIVDHFIPSAESRPDAMKSAPVSGEKRLKDDVIKICPVQKMTSAGQRSRFKIYCIVGDGAGHIGLGVKCAREVATSIRGAIMFAKLNLSPVRMGYWGNTFGKPHTVPCKVTGKCGSVRFRIIPAPRGTGLVAGRVPAKVMAFAGIVDAYTSAKGSTSTGGNFVRAAFDACCNTYKYLTPDMWNSAPLGKSPYQEFTDFLKDHNTNKPTAKKTV